MDKFKNAAEGVKVELLIRIKQIRIEESRYNIPLFVLYYYTLMVFL